METDTVTVPTLPTDDVIRERIAAGIRFLDEDRPGWTRAVRVDQVRMTSPFYCVIGQVYGHYYDAAVELAQRMAPEANIPSYYSPYDMEVRAIMAAHGFIAPAEYFGFGPLEDQYFDKLKELWSEEIRVLQAEVA